jgi:hypothetical protein
VTEKRPRVIDLLRMVLNLRAEVALQSYEVVPVFDMAIGDQSQSGAQEPAFR